MRVTVQRAEGVYVVVVAIVRVATEKPHKLGDLSSKNLFLQSPGSR